jgi:RNA polymerase sigma-70 factor (ECF subfamily)
VSNEVDDPATAGALPAEALARAYEAARAARPGIEVDRARFERHLRARVEGPGGVPLDAIHIGDLHLALAFAAGDRAALDAFERELWPDVRRALSRLRLGAAAEDELAQRIRYKLFVAEEGAEPRILAYSGKGPLRAWLRSLTVHEALSEHRRRGRDRHDTDSALGDLAAGDDPELDEMRTRYAAPFREAFQGALASLSPRERNVLRLVYAEGLSVEQVALMYGVHRVSVSRWLGQTRKDLFERTRASLRERLRVNESELGSLTRLCLSQIDVSLDRLLRGI